MQKNSKPVPGVNDIVIITFWDHAENSDDAIHFEVIGRVVSKTRLAYKLRTWGYTSEVDKEVDKVAGNSDNEHHFTIVKKAIDTIRILK